MTIEWWPMGRLVKFLTKQQAGEITSWQNGNMPKWSFSIKAARLNGKMTEQASWQNDLSTKWWTTKQLVGKLAKCQNDSLTERLLTKMVRWQNGKVGKMTHWQNDLSTEWQSGKMISWKNSKLTNWHVDTMSGRQKTDFRWN